MIYTKKYMESYSNDYLLKFFDDIEDNTLVYYGRCGEYFDYLLPLITDLFPYLKLEYIDEKHYLCKECNAHKDAFIFLVRTQSGVESEKQSIIHSNPVLFDVKELVID